MFTSSLVGQPGAHPIGQYRLKIADDMARESVLFSVEEFRDLLLPDPADRRFARVKRHGVRENPFAALKKAKDMSEMEISIALLKAINDNKLVPGCKAAHCSRPDLFSVDPDGRKIDAALFDENVDVSNGTSQWADQGVPVEFKYTLDPFDEKKNINTDQITHYAELVISIQQRLFLFMIVIVGRKFRILRWDRSGVVVSAIVDYYDNWQLFCDILWRISLAHRFAPEMLGVDPSAVRLSSRDSEWKRMATAAKPNASDVDDKERFLEDDELTKPFTFKYVRDAFRETLVDGYPRYKVEVPGNGNDKTRYFLICRPFFQAKGLAGRGTRGYVALEYDPTASKGRKARVDRFVFLKDAWRMNYGGVRPEGDVLAELNNAGVQYVPTLVCHGDIGDPVQETMTPSYWHLKHPESPDSPRLDNSSSDDPLSSMSGSLKRKRSDDATGSSNANLDDDGSDSDDDDAFETGCPMRSHVHYRYVVDEVGKSLSASDSGRKLLLFVIDCVKAHQQAYKLDILHRDISAGNILIYPRVEFFNGRRALRWVGLLTDWELSKKIDESPRRRQPERTGTWQFMSYGLLTNGSKVVELCDDLEAVFYVILYFAVRYLDSNCRNVGTYIEDFFDCYTVLKGVYYVGEKKRNAIEDCILKLTAPRSTLLFKSEPMNEVISELLASFTAHYKILDYEAQQKLVIPGLALPPTHDLVADDDDLFIPDDLVAQPGDVGEKKKKKDNNPTAPTEEERARAKNVMDHDLFLGILRNALLSKEWNKDWKDRVESTWVSLRQFGPLVNGKQSKKLRTERCPSLFHPSSAPPHTPSRPSGSRRGSRQSGRGARGSRRGARRPAAENQHQMSLRSRNP